MSKQIRLAFVTNFCAHYHIKTFETLSKYYDCDFYFFSAGNEWYWQKKGDLYGGKFKYEYLKGFDIGGTRVTPSLVQRLLTEPYDVYVKSTAGRFALPATYSAARLRRKPFVLWTGLWRPLNSTAQRAFHPVTRHIMRNSDAVAVFGSAGAEYLSREGVDPSRIFIAPHAVDSEIQGQTITVEQKGELLRQLGVMPEKKVILFLGRLAPDKGIGYLVEALPLLQDKEAILVIAGSGPQEPELRQQMVSYGLEDRVRFAGYVGTTDTARYYSIASVLVLPSVGNTHAQETWGLVVNEAFFQCVPVIVSDVVGAAASGFVQDGVNGLVVPEQNSQALASALDKILGNPELGRQMGQHGHDLTLQYDYERQVLGFRHAIDYSLDK